VRSDLPSCAVICFIVKWVFNDVAFTLFIILYCLFAIQNSVRPAEKVTPVVVVIAVVEVKVGDLLAV